MAAIPWGALFDQISCTYSTQETFSMFLNTQQQQIVDINKCHVKNNRVKHLKAVKTEIKSS